MNTGHNNGADHNNAHANVKPGLTAKRRSSVENDAYAAFVRRVLKAFSRRIAAGDIDALTDLINLAADLEVALQQAVSGLRDQGYSWTDIGNATGVTRQAAHQRWAGDA
jgi:hypothetical protein